MPLALPLPPFPITPYASHRCAFKGPIMLENPLVDVLGWLGAACVLFAYSLVSARHPPLRFSPLRLQGADNARESSGRCARLAGRRVRALCLQPGVGGQGARAIAPVPGPQRHRLRPANGQYLLLPRLPVVVGECAVAGDSGVRTEKAGTRTA